MSVSVPSAPSLGRRSVVKAGAWSLPVVAVATRLPMQAATGECTPFDVGVDWTGAGYTRTSNSKAKYVAPFTNPVTGTPATINVTLASVLVGTGISYGFEGGGATAGNLTGDNLRLSGTNIGGTGAPGITLHQNQPNTPTTGSQRNKRQELTFTFDKPVYNLSFGITDIDSQSGDFWDAIDFSSPAPYTATKGSTITGTGTPANPWATTAGNLPVDNDSGIGSVNIVFAGPVTTFTIYYWDKRTSTSSNVDNDQKVFITNLDFKVSGCDFPAAGKTPSPQKAPSQMPLPAPVPAPSGVPSPS